MQSKISLQLSLLIICIFGYLVFFSFSASGSQVRSSYPDGRKQVSAPISSIKNQMKPAINANSKLPINIKIPKINVNSNFEYVGLTLNGTVGAPKNPTSAAWFRLSPRPGEMGSSIIVGHFGWKNGISAVFDNLYKLRGGDKLYIEDENGLVVTFVVRELRVYGEDDDASDVFSSYDGKAHLNLITCEGTWNKAKKSYSNRLVVFTDME